MTKSVRQLSRIFVPANYQLGLEIFREARAFLGHVEIRGAKLTEENVRLHVAKNLKILAAKIDGESCAWKFRENDEVEFIVKNSRMDCRGGKLPRNDKDDNFAKNPQNSREILIEIDFTGEISDTALHGLYPCYYDLNGAKKELLATQFENSHAREVLPCVDEPAAKATFDLTLVTEAGVTVLANTPIISQKKIFAKSAQDVAKLARAKQAPDGVLGAESLGEGEAENGRAAAARSGGETSPAQFFRA